MTAIFTAMGLFWGDFWEVLKMQAGSIWRRIALETDCNHILLKFKDSLLGFASYLWLGYLHDILFDERNNPTWLYLKYLIVVS